MLMLSCFVYRNILNQREKFEYRLMRRNKQKSDFTLYISFLKNIIKKVQKVITQFNNLNILLSILYFNTIFYIRWVQQVLKHLNLLINIITELLIFIVHL